GAAEFAVVAGLDPPAQLRRHGHLAIADAQHRYALLEHGLRGARCVAFGDRRGSAGQNDGARSPGQRLVRLVVRHDLAIDAGFAHTPCDQLSHLAAKIENQDAHLVEGVASAARWLLLRASSAVPLAAATSLGSMLSASP